MDLQGFCIASRISQSDIIIDATTEIRQRKGAFTVAKKGKIGITPPSSPSATSTFSSKQNGFYSNNISSSPRLSSTSSDQGEISNGHFKYLDPPEVFTISNGKDNSDTLSNKSKKSHNSQRDVRGSNFSEDKYKWTDTDNTEGVTHRKTKSRKIGCIVFVSVLVAVMLAGVAVILAFKVFNVGETPAQEVTAIRPDEILMEGSLDLKQTWTVDLADPSSELYKSTADSFTSEMDLLMENSSFSDSYIRTEVIQFSPGSIKVLFNMLYNDRYKLKANAAPAFAAMIQKHIKKQAPRSRLPIDDPTIYIRVPEKRTSIRRVPTTTTREPPTTTSTVTTTPSTTTTTMEPDEPPRADAGPNITVTLPVKVVIAYGDTSTDDKGIVRYKWENISPHTLSVVMRHADEKQMRLYGLEQGVYTFKLTVFDVANQSDSDITFVTVKPAPDDPPVAYAGTDISITLPENTCTLNAAGSSDDNGIVRNTWENISPQTLRVDMLGTRTSLLKLSNMEEGVYTFRLTVYDAVGQSSIDTVKVTVNPAPTTTTTSTSSTTTTATTTTTTETTTTTAETTTPLTITSSTTTPDPNLLCTPVVMPTCEIRGFRYTSLPNPFGHTTMAEIVEAFEVTAAEVYNQHCQDSALEYLCSLYVPKCDYTTGMQIFPCSSLCAEAVETCSDYFSNPVKCENLANTNCVNRTVTKPTPAPTTPTPAPCYSTDLKECHDIGFTSTRFPNFIHEPNQTTAMQSFNGHFRSIWNSGCYSDFLYFVCSLQFPMCEGTTVKPPCKRTCNAVKNACLDWLSCDTFPDIDCMSPPEPVPECHSNQFTCGKVSKCVSADKVCNGVNDCADWTDEMDCQCNEYEYQCAMGMCIKSYQRCDKVSQCPDGSDEEKCGNCTNGQVECPMEGKCIMSEWICDGRRECNDGWDEHNCDICPRGKFQCTDKSCIDISQICNLVPDCPDGFDEWECVRDHDKDVLELKTMKRWTPVCASSWSDMYGDYTCTQLLGKGAYIDSTAVTYNHFTFAELTHTGSISSSLGTINIITNCPGNKAVRINCEPRGCGRRSVVNQVPLVVGGENSAPGEWPWHVALYFGGQYFCGGTLINNNFVLTAAHCVERYANDFRLLTVKLGANNREIPEETQHVIKVEAINSHSDHKYFERNDIALLQLANPVSYTNYVQPVCLPAVDEPLPLYSDCYTIGWGKTKWDGDYANVLQKLKMDLWDTNKCNSSIAWNGEVYDTFLCAGYISGVRSICSGDSGGPLLCLDKTNSWKIMGIASYVANFCNMTERPNIFTDVKRFIPWIENIIECKFRCDNGKCLYNKDQICDRVDHCGDNSDEMRICNRTIQCDFQDKYMCGYRFTGWKLGHDNKLSARIEIDGQLYTQSNAPQYDHTIGRYPGKFLYGKQINVKSAQLTSPKYNLTGQTCIRFSYFLRGDIQTGLQVYMYEYSRSGRSTKQKKWDSGYSMTGVDHWQTGYFDATLGEVQLEFVTGDLLKAAIDDIKIIDGMCHNVLCDSSTEFKCQSESGNYDNCIPRQSQCNLVIDCYNGVDESGCSSTPSSYTCSFEDGNLCALDQTVGDASDWWLVNASFVRAELRSKDFVDHTTGLDSGHMFYVNAYGIQSTSHVNMSQRFYLHDTQYCLSFYYQLESDVKFNINLDCTGCNRRTLVAQATFDNWTLFQVDLPIVDILNVTYDVQGRKESIDDVYLSYIAIDDIHVKPGLCPPFTCSQNYTKCKTSDHCIPQSKICDRKVNCYDESDENQCDCAKNEFKCTSGRCIPKKDMCDRKTQCLDGSDEGEACAHLRSVTCTFEDSYMCGYEIIQYTKYTWQRWTGYTPTPITGPFKDHTFENQEDSAQGHYMYAEANEGSKGDNVTLASPEFHTGLGKSLEFYYHIFSSSPSEALPGNIQLTLENLKTSESYVVFSSNMDLFDRWQLACVNLPDGVSMRAFFTAYRNETTLKGVDIAIDDVKLNQKMCSEKTTPKPGPRTTNPPTTSTTSLPPQKTCPSDEWKCNDDMCIKASYHCDGERDCRDGSDELDCN